LSRKKTFYPNKLNSCSLEFRFFTLKNINSEITIISHKWDVREYSRSKKTPHIARTLMALLDRIVLRKRWG